ncbi:MAG TPA: PepSY-associated TM helix domain-containing protein [Polyangiaceae bacterium]|nr:PepSY-associated TM helix domain-containing protein [Polyangiaceae bacterium]
MPRASVVPGAGGASRASVLPRASVAPRAPAARAPLATAHRVRALSLVVHRWVGLVMASFLTVAGVTGSIIAFYPQLDALLNPELFVVDPPAPGALPLDPFELRDRVAQQLPPGQTLDDVVLEVEPGKSVNYWFDERENFFDPYTGRKLGARRFGDLSEGKKNLLTFIYRFHYSLGLDDVGTWIFGIVALLWTIDCFVGGYLTFPVKLPASSSARGGSWLRRWAPAWLLKASQLFSLVFTWHRASGLWVWGFLLVFAWSAVALNLDVVYQPVMSLVLPRSEEPEPPLRERPVPQLTARAAHARARELLAHEAQTRGFQVIGERSLYYDAEHGRYQYTVESTLDIGPRLAETSVVLDGDDGRWLGFHSPTTEGLRNRIDRWLIALHFGSVREGGIVYRAFVCVLGTMVALLSITGVWIWWRKRSKRQKRAPRPEVKGARRLEATSGVG